MTAWGIEVPIYVPASDYILTFPGAGNTISADYDSVMLLCPADTKEAIQLDLNDNTKPRQIVRLAVMSSGQPYCEPLEAPQDGDCWANGGCYIVLDAGACRMKALGMELLTDKVLVPLYDALESAPDKDLPF